MSIPLKPDSGGVTTRHGYAGEPDIAAAAVGGHRTGQVQETVAIETHVGDTLKPHRPINFRKNVIGETQFISANDINRVIESPEIVTDVTVTATVANHYCGVCIVEGLVVPISTARPVECNKDTIAGKTIG